MKKLIFLASMVAALFLAGSCQRENLEPVEQGGTVTYTVQMPGALATKAANGYELIYEVYRQDNTLVYESKTPIAFDQTGKVELSLEFVKDQTFTVLFWAQNSGCTAYDVKDLRAVSLANNLKANDENAEAFAGKDVVTNCVSAAENGNVVLVRPIAQLNIATLTESLSLGVTGSTTSPVNPEYVEVAVNGLYTTYNVATGDVANETNVSYTKAEIPANDTFNTDYIRLGMNYIGFIPSAGDNVVVDFTIYTKNDGNIEHTVSNVPVKPNYQTNILGNLISATADYSVTLEGWADAQITHATDAEAAQAALDNAAAGSVIQLHPGVNYGTLYLRPVAGSPATKNVDWIGNNYRYETYSLFKDITIRGAEGATVDAIKIEGGTYYNTEHSQDDLYPVMLSLIELKNVVIDGVTFTGKGGYDPQGHGNAINLSGNNIKVDGLTIKNCTLNNPENNARLLYKTESTTHVHNYSYDGVTYTFSPSLKDITITGCTLNGGYMGLELRETENVSITNNEFNVGDRNILLAVNTGFTYSGNITITGNVSNNAKERFVRADGTGDAEVIITGNTLNNYLGADADYIKVTGGNNVTIENNTISVGAQDAASAQTALDNAVPGDKIQLQPGVNYGTLEIKANPGHNNTTLVDIADAWAYNYVRTIEDVTIIGAEGAKVDGIVFKTGAQPGDQNNRVVIENLTIENVEFTDAFTSSSAGYNAPIMITTSNASVNGLTVKGCKLMGDNSKLNLVYLYGDAGSKNVTLTDNTVRGIARLCELRGTENVTITNNVINDTYEHAMLLAGGNYAGKVTITGNTADGIHDRFVRMSGAGDAEVVIKDNIIENYLGNDQDYIKVTDGNNVTIENNTFVYKVATVDDLKSVLSNAVDNIMVKLAGADFGAVDLYNSTNNGHRYNYANYKAKNVKIVGENGASFSTLRLGENDYQPTMTGWTFENITFTGNGLQISLNNEGVLVQNCKFINSELMNTGTDAYQAKNFTVQSCSFEGSRPDNRKTQLALQNSNGVKISGCSFRNSGYSAINVSKIYGSVEITGNNIYQTADRPLRFVLAANEATLKITYNTIVSEGDDNGELMKVSAETGIVVTEEKVNLSGNTWNGKSDAEITAGIVDGNYIVK